MTMFARSGIARDRCRSMSLGERRTVKSLNDQVVSPLWPASSITGWIVSLRSKEYSRVASGCVP